MNKIDEIRIESEVKRQSINMVDVANVISNELDAIMDTLHLDEGKHEIALNLYELLLSWHTLSDWVRDNGETTGHSTQANRAWLSSLSEDLDQLKKSVKSNG